MKDPGQLPANRIEKLIESAVKLAEAYFKLIKLDVRNGVASAITVIVLVSLLLFLLSLIVFFFSMAAALLISEIHGISLAGSCAIVAGFYVILTFVLASQRRRIKQIIIDTIESQVRENT